MLKIYSVEEVGEIAGEMLGNRLVTKQTGPAGQLVTKVQFLGILNLYQTLTTFRFL